VITTANRVAFGAGLFLGLMSGLTVGVPAGVAIAHAATEDQPGWSCVDDGNQICGPGNTQGAPAGRYDEGGVLIETWDQMLARCGHIDICLGA